MAKNKKLTAVYQGDTAKGLRRYNIARKGNNPFGSIYVNPNKMNDEITIILDHGDEDEDEG